MLALLGALGAGAQTPSMATKRMSMEDCLQAALEHNLDIKIQRYNPEVAQYSVSLSYSRYDPSFSFSASHDSVSQAPGFNTFIGTTLPSYTYHSETFNSGISGSLPSGLNYNASGNLRDFFSQHGGAPGSLSYQGGASISLSQPLLKDFWIDSTRLQIQLAKKNLKVSVLALRQQIMTTVTSVEQAYYNLIYAEENVRVQEKALQLANQLLAENKKRVEVGNMAPLDEKQAESQAATAQAALLAARQTLRIQQNTLKNLLSDRFSQWEDVAIEPNEHLVAMPANFNRAESWERGLTLRPDVQQMRINLEKQGITLKFDFNQLFPALNINGSYGRNGAASPPGVGSGWGDVLDQFIKEDNPSYSYGATLTFPLSNRAARYQYRIDKATQKQLLLQFQQKEQQVMVDIDNALSQAQTDFDRVSATHEATLYAQDALDAEEKKLENGKSTSFVVLQLQSNLTTARSQEIRALADYNIDLAQVALQDGTTLERARIQVRVK